MVAPATAQQMAAAADPCHRLFARAAAPTSSGRILGTRCKSGSASRSSSRTSRAPGHPSGNELVATPSPTGYTLGIMTAGQIIAAVTRKSMPYDNRRPGRRWRRSASASLLIATRPDFPADTVKELVAAAKADPGKIVFCESRLAATQHFAGELFKQVPGWTCCTCRSAARPKPSTAVLGQARRRGVRYRVSVDRPGAVRRPEGARVTGKDLIAAVPDVPAAVEPGVLPGYDVNHLVRACSDPAGHPGADRRQAQQDAPRYRSRRQGARAPRCGRRGGARLDGGGVRQLHGRTSTNAGTPCAKPPALPSSSKHRSLRVHVATTCAAA